jgi:hypothetical protein
MLIIGGAGDVAVLGTFQTKFIDIANAIRVLNPTYFGLDKRLFFLSHWSTSFISEMILKSSLQVYT